jgi:hypothetical protein
VGAGRYRHEPQFYGKQHIAQFSVVDDGWVLRHDAQHDEWWGQWHKRAGQ